MSQQIPIETFTSEGDNSQSVECALNSGASWFTHTGLFLINLDFTLRKLQGFLTNLPTLQPTTQ